MEQRLEPDRPLLRLQQHFEAVDLEAIDESQEAAARLIARVVLTLAARNAALDDSELLAYHNEVRSYDQARAPMPRRDRLIR